MAKQKVTISSNIYDDEEPGAIAKLTGAVPRKPGVGESSLPSGPSVAASPETAGSAPASGTEQQVKQTRNVKPTSIYLTPAQLRKLDQLAYEYNEQTEKRINRNDIIRYLVDRCTLEHLHGL